MRLHTVIPFGLALFLPVAVAAQDRGWVAEVSVGWAGLVDDATKNYLWVGGTVRRHLSRGSALARSL